MKTTLAKPGSVPRAWVLIDAKGAVLGRLASRIVLVLRGKHKVAFTPHVDTGDHVIVINARHVTVTGRKRRQETLQRYSGYPGGRKVVTLGDALARDPTRVLREAVKGMLPDGPLGRRLLRKLLIYADGSHPHGAQRPTAMQPLGRRDVVGTARTDGDRASG